MYFPTAMLIILCVWHCGSTVKTMELHQDGIVEGGGEGEGREGWGGYDFNIWNSTL